MFWNTNIHIRYRNYTNGNRLFTLTADQQSLRNGRVAMRTRCQIFLRIRSDSFGRSPDSSFDFLLVLDIQQFTVLRSHQNGRVLIGGVLQTGSVAFDDRRCQNRHSICENDMAVTTEMFSS